MSRSREIENLERALGALELTLEFAAARDRLGLDVAVARLRIGLNADGLWLGDDDGALLGAILSGEATDDQIHLALNGPRRTGIDQGK
jgi:hypothetical protein